MKLHETRHDGVGVLHLEGRIDLHYASAAIRSGCMPEPPKPLFRHADDDRSTLVA